MDQIGAVDQTNAGDQITVTTIDGRPVEFTWRGRRWRIHTILTRFKRAGGWWQRPALPAGAPDDAPQEIWQVEAAPEGALGLFHLTVDQRTGTWRVER